MDNKTTPLIILAAIPHTKIIIDNFFYETGNPIFELLKNPPYLRYMGWNLLTLDYPKIIEGKCWEVKNGLRKTIRLYQNGGFVTKAPADNSFLGWGQNNEEFLNYPKLNTLALAEYVYEFTELYRKLLGSFPLVNKVRFTAEMRNTKLTNGKQLLIHPYPVFSPFYSFDFNTTNHIVNKDFIINEDILLKNNQYDSRYESYKLLSIIYNYFNVTSDKIPYTKKDNNSQYYIDLDSIKDVK